MPRSPRDTLWTAAPCYHVMSRGQDRGTFFADEGDFAYLVSL